MRIVGIILILASLPLFLSFLRSVGGRRWAFIALGALPILSVPLNLDAALMDWAYWPGHTKGLLLNIVDALALVICGKYLKSKQRLPMLWAWLLYIGSLVPGLFSGPLFEPAAFFVFQSLRVFLVAYATYLAASKGYLFSITLGVAIAIIVNGAAVVKDILSGFGQAPGLLGHQNLTGMVTNLCVPLLLTMGLRGKGTVFIVAVVAAGLSAVAGGSRATIVFYGIGVVGTLLGSLAVKPTSYKLTAASLIVLALVATAPLSVDKLQSRGGLLSVDLERVAFERAANMMIHDHRMGVGINQYVTTANAGGYLERAGVRWGQGARAAHVHNLYLLMHAEGGIAALGGLLILLLVPVAMAVRHVAQRANANRDIAVAVALALLGSAAHSQYEWIMVTATPQYLLGIMIGVLSSVLGLQKHRSPRSLPHEPSAAKVKVAVALARGSE